jgi:hypothetical protein
MLYVWSNPSSSVHPSVDTAKTKGKMQSALQKASPELTSAGTFDLLPRTWAGDFAGDLSKTLLGSGSSNTYCLVAHPGFQGWEMHFWGNCCESRFAVGRAEGREWVFVPGVPFLPGKPECWLGLHRGTGTLCTLKIPGMQLLIDIWKLTLSLMPVNKSLLRTALTL